MMHLCLFCKEELNNFFYNKLNVYFCKNCMAEFMFDKSYKRVSLYTSILDSMYRVSYYQSYICNTVPPYHYELWFIGEPGIPGVSINKKLYFISYIPGTFKVNPDNVNKKIKDILAFI